MKIIEIITESKKLVFPSRRLILTVYNKYRKGYDYSNDVHKLRSLVLPLAKAMADNSQEYYDSAWFWSVSPNVPPEQGKFFARVGTLVSGQGPDWVNGLRRLIAQLKTAKTDQQMLVAIDLVFNYIHDQGPILTHMVGGRDKDDYDRVMALMDTLDSLKDW